LKAGISNVLNVLPKVSNMSNTVAAALAGVVPVAAASTTSERPQNFRGFDDSDVDESGFSDVTSDTTNPTSESSADMESDMLHREKKLEKRQRRRDAILAVRQEKAARETQAMAPLFEDSDVEAASTKVARPIAKGKKTKKAKEVKKIKKTVTVDKADDQVVDKTGDDDAMVEDVVEAAPNSEPAEEPSVKENAETQPVDASVAVSNVDEVNKDVVEAVGKETGSSAAEASSSGFAVVSLDAIIAAGGPSPTGGVSVTAVEPVKEADSAIIGKEVAEVEYVGHGVGEGVEGVGNSYYPIEVDDEDEQPKRQLRSSRPSWAAHPSTVTSTAEGSGSKVSARAEKEVVKGVTQASCSQADIAWGIANVGMVGVGGHLRLVKLVADKFAKEVELLGSKGMVSVAAPISGGEPLTIVRCRLSLGPSGSHCSPSPGRC
jgi:hypothetical protein